MRVASEAVTFWCELGKGDTALAYKNRACAGCLCSIEAQVPRFPDPRPCPSLGREKSCRAAPRKAGAAGTLTRSPSPKARHPGRGWGCQGWGQQRQGALGCQGGAPPPPSTLSCLPLQNGLSWYFQATQLFICISNSMPLLSSFACGLSEAHLM